jgi:hypothetical protein
VNVNPNSTTVYPLPMPLPPGVQYFSGPSVFIPYPVGPQRQLGNAALPFPGFRGGEEGRDESGLGVGERGRERERERDAESLDLDVDVEETLWADGRQEGKEAQGEEEEGEGEGEEGVMDVGDV